MMSDGQSASSTKSRGSSGLPLAHHADFPHSADDANDSGRRVGRPTRKFSDAYWRGKSLALPWLDRSSLSVALVHFPPLGVLALGSWNFLASGGSRVPPLQIRLPPPRAFSFTCVAKADLNLFCCLNGPSVIIGDTVPEYIIDPGGPIQVALSHVALFLYSRWSYYWAILQFFIFFYLLVSSLGPGIHMTLHSWRTILCRERR
jgi:hypothetical protein